MNSFENRRNLLGEKEPEPEPVTAEEREEFLALVWQLAQPEVSVDLRLEIAAQIRIVLLRNAIEAPYFMPDRSAIRSPTTREHSFGRCLDQCDY